MVTCGYKMGCPKDSQMITCGYLNVRISRPVDIQRMYMDHLKVICQSSWLQPKYFDLCHFSLATTDIILRLVKLTPIHIKMSLKRLEIQLITILKTKLIQVQTQIPFFTIVYHLKNFNDKLKTRFKIYFKGVDYNSTRLMSLESIESI